MGKTKISWCDYSFNPWWGCVRVSPGCQNCYAETFSKRTGHNVWGPESNRRFFGDRYWAKLESWNTKAAQDKKRFKVFSGSMCDVFEDLEIYLPHRQRLFEAIEKNQHLIFLLLTKRPENIPHLSPAEWTAGSFPHNVWVGTSIEDQARANQRVPDLLKIPAQRFVSCEPLLGPIDLTEAMYGPEPAGMNCFGFTDGFGEEAFLHWVIAGGESGAGHRPMEIDWISNLHEQCVAGDVAFFCKQDAHRYPEQRGRIPYGIWNTKQWPAAMTGGRCLT